MVLALSIRYMFLRVTRQKLASGKMIAHYQLAESTWDREKRQSRVNILYNFGRADDAKCVEELRKLARSIIRLTSPDDIPVDHTGWTASASLDIPRQHGGYHHGQAGQ